MVCPRMSKKELMLNGLLYQTRPHKKLKQKLKFEASQEDGEFEGDVEGFVFIST